MKKLFLVILLAVSVASGVRGLAQVSDAPAAPPQTPSQAQDANKPHLGRQLAEESREAAGEDDTAQFKRSGAVQFVAKITGLGMEHAYWLCVVLNFAIVAVAVFWFSRKNLPGMFRNRTAMIQKAMEEARQASADANRRLNEVESRLSKLGAEIAAMSAAGEKEAAAEEERIKAAAEEDGRRIVATAEHEIDAAAKSARRDLTAFAADLAVSLAKKQIHVDENSDQALVGSFASQLSGNGELRKDQR
jgi:F-type H+-transporting ATPase subunit b